MENLQEEFKIRIQENPIKFLGTEFAITDNSLHMNQTKTVNELLKDFNMSEAKAASTPAVDTADEEETEINRVFTYRGTARQTSLPVKTRQDISYAVNLCSRKVEKPTNGDITSLKRILKYLKGTSYLGIRFVGDSSTKLIGYCDSDCAGVKTDKEKYYWLCYLLLWGTIQLEHKKATCHRALPYRS
ncbi:hypothetical protein PR048_007959 [Dryococelus australis]|uniref:Uncharacterized protein n=1 Tax=Dryococelus australis TaxID=614101 RepID=A0ABQ9HVQ2_9NEOP|nr:hypothetical protein PR048_007959 [Dryococelus australis]